jgi:hypothetical protein
MARIDWDRLVGMTYAEAWEYIQRRATLRFIHIPMVVR